MRKWEDFVSDAQTLSAPEFSARHRHPVLVLLAVEGQVDTSQPDRFKTQFAKPNSLSMAVRSQAAKTAAADTDDAEPVILGTVFSVQKRAGNAYPTRISLGRTKTNDLILSYPLISKFHAYITFSTDGEPSYSITDAAATNGTSVDGTLLVSGTETPLSDGATVRLGPYRLLFLTPKAFREHLLKPPTSFPRDGR